jgi:hypothetical protein
LAELLRYGLGGKLGAGWAARPTGRASLFVLFLFFLFPKPFLNRSLNAINFKPKATSIKENMLQHEMHQHVSIPMLDFIFNKIYLFTNLNAHKNT